LWVPVLAFALTLQTAADPESLSRVLRDHAADEHTKRQAALDLGCIGGDRIVRYLETALREAPPEMRPSIAMALGNTRSRLAVPVLIRMFGDDSARDEVCDALFTLTHRTWCDGADDDAALRKTWRRWWSQMKSRVEIHGAETCEPAARANPPGGR